MSSVRLNSDWIDGSLYPDREPPDNLDDLIDKVDFISRLCSAWDFGILPFPETLKHILRPEWKKAIDETQMLTSCAYHLLREMHGLPPLPYIGQGFPEIMNDAYLSRV